ncbi:MAG: hypothetical protein AAB675_01295 [Patescibacteria group bacterium]
MPKKHSASINLVKGDKDDLLNKFIDWALTIGRLLVIITEIIALSSFIYRFTLDRQIIDLHSRNKQLETQVNFFSSKEEIYRNLQGRLAVSSEFSSAGQTKVNIFKDVLAFATSGMTYENVTITENSVNIDATFQSASSLKSFINALRQYPALSNVSIGKIENRLSNAQIVVAISADLAKK